MNSNIVNTTVENTIIETASEMVNPLIAQAAAFTDTYKRYSSEHIAIREAMCLKTQYPALLPPLRRDDLLAGRRPLDMIVYVGTIWWSAFPGWRAGIKSEGKQGGYCVNFAAVEKFAKTEAEIKLLSDILDFWETECSVTRVGGRLDEETQTYLSSNGQVGGGNTGFAVALDLDKLLQLGIPGLISQVEARTLRAERNGEDTGFLKGLRLSLDVVIEVCQYYARQAHDFAQEATDSKDKKRFQEIASTLETIMVQPPRTFREAMQLLWLYSVLACGKHLEGPRLDVALGDFYANDIDAGRITPDEALTLIRSLWQFFNENGETATCRVVVGGQGRRNEANADRFALAALEATLRHHAVTPQFTVRFYEGQNPLLLQRAFDVVGENGVYPILYNDDTVVPGITKSLGVPKEDAQQYHPLGCGEYMLGGCSPSLLDFSWSVPKTLDAVLHNGVDVNGVVTGPHTGDPASLDTFDKLYAAFLEQVRFSADLTARAYKNISTGHPQNCTFLLASLLTSDCVERGKPLLGGGERYLGACVMGHGFTNAADALTAIRQFVYTEKRLTLPELVAMLDANFSGHEAARKMLLDAPKFGNDNDVADNQLVTMWRDINAAVHTAGVRSGFDFLIISSVNPGGFFSGAVCGATADGRRGNQPFAIGNSPTAGFDKNGLTALFNSVAKVEANNGGATTNFKMSREFFTNERAKMEALFKVYFKNGGMQANITVINRNDLEAALKEPEKYAHVMVRLGGWSARFVDLDRTIQEEIIRRTLY